MPLVYTNTNPWTQEGKNTAIQKAVADIYEPYFAKGPRWIAQHLPETADMSEARRARTTEPRTDTMGSAWV